MSGGSAGKAPIVILEESSGRTWLASNQLGGHCIIGVGLEPVAGNPLKFHIARPYQLDELVITDPYRTGSFKVLCCEVGWIDDYSMIYDCTSGRVISILQNAAERAFHYISYATMSKVLQEIAGRGYIGANKFRKASMIVSLMQEEWGLRDDMVEALLQMLRPSDRDAKWRSEKPAKLEKKQPVARDSLPPRAPTERQGAEPLPCPIDKIEYSPASLASRSGAGHGEDPMEPVVEVCTVAPRTPRNSSPKGSAGSGSASPVVDLSLVTCQGWVPSPIVRAQGSPSASAHDPTDDDTLDADDDVSCILSDEGMHFEGEGDEEGEEEIKHTVPLHRVKLGRSSYQLLVSCLCRHVLVWAGLAHSADHDVAS